MATDIQLTPTPGMPPVTTETSGQTATTGETATTGASGIAPTPEAQAAAQAEVAAVQQQAQAQGAVGGAEAGKQTALAAGQELMGMQASVDAERAAKIQQRYQAKIAAAESAARQAEQERANFTWPDFWGPSGSAQRAGKVALGAVSSFFGGFGGALVGQPDEALANINKALDRNLEEKRLALLSKDNLAKWKRQGVTDIYGQMQHELANLDVEHGMLMKAAASKAEAQALKAGATAEEAKNNVLVAGFLAGAAAKDTAAKQRYEQNFDRKQQQSDELARRSETQVTTAKGAKAEHADVKEVSEADAALRNIDAMIGQLKDHPEAWTEYRDNAEAWQRAEASKGGHITKELRTGAQMLGAANVAPEQGLKTDQGKTMHQRQEALNTGIAKSFGGVITEGDRSAAASQQGNLALSPEEKVKQLQELRANLEAKRNEYVNNRGVQPGYSPTAKPAEKKPDRAQLERQRTNTIRWIKDHPKDQNVKAARADLARINSQLGAAP